MNANNWEDKLNRTLDPTAVQRDILFNIITLCYAGESHPSIKGIEIGVMDADTSFSLLERLPNLTLYGIDPDMHKTTMRDNDRSLFERLKLIEVESDLAINAFKHKVDFVWVDGDHSYEQVKRDILNYKPIAKKFIGGHDYGSQAYAGVKKAVDEIFGDRVIVLSDFVWLVRM